MIDRVAVVGLGLIGGSMGAALRRQGRYVLGFDSDPAASELALRRGLVDALGGDLEAALDGVEAVILAVPVLASLDLVRRVDALAASGVLIVDTGSVKRPVVEVMELLPGAARALGGHPLAGKEESGPAAAAPDLFDGRPFFLVPSARTSRETVDRAEQLVRAVGARPVRMGAAEHDRLLARTSHLPQLVSTALAICQEGVEARLAGPGLRDMTRLARSDVRMWRDIFVSNRDNVAEAAHHFLRELEGMIGVVEAADEAALGLALERGRGAARRLKEEAVV